MPLSFIGRFHELEQLNSVSNRKQAALVIVYGRRRVGKTTLVEHAFAKRGLLKFEGVEGKSDRFQIELFASTLRKLFPKASLSPVEPTSWTHAFEMLARAVARGKWTIYFEELQWMANYRSDLIAELKPIWDNALSKNPDLVLVLCGSSPSYFISEVIRSRSLHNRSHLDLRLEEFPIGEACHFLGDYPLRLVFDAYLTVGGIPIYLEKLRDKSSVYQSLCFHSFRKGSFFSEEFDKVFVSSFGSNPSYRHLVQSLGQKGNQTRDRLAKTIGAKSGGNLTNMLLDLEACGFIRKVVPLDKQPNSLLAYYQIRDPFLHFYFKFIEPIQGGIQNGDFTKYPERVIDTRSYSQWLGFSFERFCRQNASLIADRLGFGQVRYRSGVYFRRGTVSEYGAQIDLLFDRADRVYSACEVKYQDAPVGTEVIGEMERKITALEIGKTRSVHKVLISSSGITDGLKKRHYFDTVLSIEDLFDTSP
jgi:uncharacterized protein